MHSQDNDATTQSKRAPEVEEILNLLSLSGSGAELASVSYDGWDKKRRPRPKSQPSFDPITIRSDNYHSESRPSTSNHTPGLILMEAALVPNLSYVGIGVSNAPKKSEESKNNNGCFFYPNGTKSISMRTTIQDSMRKINEESLNPPKRKPKKSINQYGKKLEKSYSNTLEKEIQLKRTNHLRKHTQVYTNSLRTSLIDRPLTAASTSSIMKLKGKSIDSYGNDGSFSMSQSSNNSDQLSTTSSSSSSSSSPSSSSNSMSRQRPSTTDATMERNRHGNGNGTFRGRIGSKESNLSRPSSSFSVMSNNDESNSQVHNRGDSGNGDIKKLNIADMKRRLKSSSGRLEMGLMQQHPTSYYY